MNLNLSKYDSSKRLVYIDIFRDFGIICMVMGHIGFGGLFDKFIHSFHMPMFFVISGMFFKEKSVESTLNYIKMKAKKLLIPYFSLGIIQYVIWQYISYPKWNIVLLKNLFFVNTNELAIAGALWFLTALFWADILYFIIRKYIKNKKIYISLIILLAIIGNMENTIIPFKLPYSLGAAFVGVGLLHIGWCLYNIHNVTMIFNMNIKKIIVLLIGTIVLIFLNGNVNMRLGQYSIVPLFWINAILATVVGINLCKILEEKNFKFGLKRLSYIGQNSIVYVCLNQLTIIFVTCLIGKHILPKIIYKIIVLVITMILLRVEAIILLNSKLKFLFGK